jgi:hypothetical protein
MLKQPVHGFAIRVDDIVASAGAILQSRHDHASNPEDRPLSGRSSSHKIT